ncbi:hypothetical protein [Streptomyces sp. VRA16 Mangrove soil]|uniref:hypothetical protein n=1 Tax=Streptomyces sp. VRA16 Mangrove soil TaxID=2817434 RepID=UPI001A9FA3D3|nr:hypothetical protein [Streptomyces sp. VRA16 Mangrove soil]MBO1336886.1 hypothetical protein [Streptomyces sp. VRA16 Mangrove soil]
MRTGRPLIAAAFAVAVSGLWAVPAVASPGGLEVYPVTAAPGSTVTVDTTACGAHGTAAGDAGAVGAGPFTLAPDTDDAAGPADSVGRFTVPVSAQPGTYEIVARCSGGTRVTGDLIVSLTEPGAPGAQMPKGHVETGVGGALGPDPVQTAAGVAALAVAAAGGTWLLHRRARGDGI